MNTKDFLTGKEDMQEDSLVRLKKLVTAFKTRQAEVAKIEEELKNKKALLNTLGQEEIPELLLAHGLSEIKLDTGDKVVVKEDINATITDELAFFKYLEKNNAADLIKHAFMFGQLEFDILVDLHEYLLERDILYEDSKGVAAQTRKKYFRELLGVGLTAGEYDRAMIAKTIKKKEVVEKFANIFTYHTTKIKEPKKVAL